MPKNILEEIVAHKRTEINHSRRKAAESDLRRAAAAETSKRRSLWRRLEDPGPAGINVIAEIKRASPSRGALNPGLDPEAYAAEYERGGAAALSVLTDAAFFRGSLDDLGRARRATRLPVLRKDFIISAYQLYESAAWKADAVLLIVRILAAEQLRDLLQLSAELGLDALVEVHTTAEIDTATRAGARLIGINNRNLASFDTDVDHAARLVGRLAAGQVAVAASGIRGREDIERSRQAGIHNFLIGESLVCAKDPQTFLAGLLGHRAAGCADRPKERP